VIEFPQISPGIIGEELGNNVIVLLINQLFILNHSLSQETSSNYRWTICSLVFFATTVNYLDRAVISLLKKTLTAEFNWSETDYGNIVIAFQVSYAIGLLGAGRLIDKLGTKLGYALATALWSIAAIAHAFAKSTIGFGVARAALGVTEAGNFPAAIKVTAEWFPKKERALATGIFNSGSNIGAILAPLTVPWIATTLGWQWAFVITGAIGFVWLMLWYIYYEVPARHKKVSQKELDLIYSDKEAVPQQEGEEQKLSWMQLLGYKQTWVFAIGKFLTDPIWWFYLFWLPDFLDKEYHLSGTAVALPVALVYTMAAVGSIFGGWLPMNLIKKNWPVFRARRTSMLIYAIAVLPVLFAQWLGKLDMWYAVLVIGLAAAAHQAWSANIFTTVSDMFPKSAVASVTGIGGMFGAIGGIVIAKLAPLLLEHYKKLGNLQQGYFIMFIICGLAYITAWLIMRMLLPKEKPL
jgi:MFS transporter, ACS family, hexuronate transporter